MCSRIGGADSTGNQHAMGCRAGREQAWQYALRAQTVIDWLHRVVSVLNPPTQVKSPVFGSNVSAELLIKSRRAR